MSSSDTRLDQLYALLPAVYRARDDEQGQPLRALLQVIAEQVEVLGADLESLYDNWFIETCDDWVVPYLGALVGYRPTAGAGARSAAGCGLAVSARREVARTIHYRRRKGSAHLLESLARDVGGWPSHAVETRQGLLCLGTARDVTSSPSVLVDLRAQSRLEQRGGPFEALPGTLDVRRIDSAREPGLKSPANVGVFCWRLRAHSITHAPACCLEDVGPHWFSFSALGNDVPLFNQPRATGDEQPVRTESDVPSPIRLYALGVEAPARGPRAWQASEEYYGLRDGSQRGQSFAVWAPGWAGVDDGPIPAAQVIPADLSNFSYTPPKNYIAVDPRLGRIAFPAKQLPKNGVWVSYHYGFPGDVGGGEYRRPMSDPTGAIVTRVSTQDELRAALQPWRAVTAEAQPRRAIIEFTNSGVYVLPIGVTLQAGCALELRAAPETRPIIRLLDWQTDRPDSMTITGGRGSRFVLDGIMVAGRGVRVEGDLGSFVLRHSTLVPGWTLAPDCTPERPSEPSIELIDSRACLVIDHSIVGSLQINNGEVGDEPVRIEVADSVIDATGSDCNRPECEAIGAEGSLRAHAVLSVRRSTVIGRVSVHAIALGQDSIFTGLVSVARRQLGCMRYCYVRPGSRTPRRFACQPDQAEAAAERRLRESTSLPAPESVAAVRELERLRVRPEHTTLRYGRPGYCQLTPSTAPEVGAGAENGSAMGVFHHLAEPLRLSSLQQRLEEYVPAASNVAVLFVN
jgi:hypothetical protein